MFSPFLTRLIRASLILLFCTIYLARWGRVSLDQIISYGAYPFYALHAAAHTQVASWREQRRSWQEMADALAASQKTAEELRARLVALQAQGLYLEDTAPAREFCARYACKGAIPAQVMSRSCSAQEQIIVLDAGASQGVRQDMVVVHANGIVGRVLEVFPWYCRAILVTDKRCKIPVVCVQSGTDAIYEGINAAYEGQLLFVSCLQELHTGDTIMTSGKGTVYPEGFAVGVLDSVTQDKQGLYYVATVIPYCDPLCISRCMIMSKEMVRTL